MDISTEDEYTENDDLTCSICNTAFSSKHGLKRHTFLLHTTLSEIPKYVCPHGNCNSSYHRSDHLARHMATVHTKNVKPKYVCHIRGCEKSFNYPYHLRRHILMHGTEIAPKKEKKYSKIRNLKTVSPAIVKALIDASYSYNTNPTTDNGGDNRKKKKKKGGIKHATPDELEVIQSLIQGAKKPVHHNIPINNTTSASAGKRKRITNRTDNNEVDNEEDNYNDVPILTTTVSKRGRLIKSIYHNKNNKINNVKHSKPTDDNENQVNNDNNINNNNTSLSNDNNNNSSSSSTTLTTSLDQFCTALETNTSPEVPSRRIRKISMLDDDFENFSTEMSKISPSNMNEDSFPLLRLPTLTMVNEIPGLANVLSYTCPIKFCNFTCITKREIRLHFKHDHSDIHIYECPRCNITTKNWKILLEHTAICNGVMNNDNNNNNSSSSSSSGTTNNNVSLIDPHIFDFDNSISHASSHHNEEEMSWFLKEALGVEFTSSNTTSISLSSSSASSSSNNKSTMLGDDSEL